jgi:hypothetical protein
VRIGEFCRYGEDPSSDWKRTGTAETIEETKQNAITKFESRKTDMAIDVAG